MRRHRSAVVVTAVARRSKSGVVARTTTWLGGGFGARAQRQKLVRLRSHSSLRSSWRGARVAVVVVALGVREVVLVLVMALAEMVSVEDKGRRGRMPRRAWQRY